MMFKYINYFSNVIGYIYDCPGNIRFSGKNYKMKTVKFK